MARRREVELEEAGTQLDPGAGKFAAFLHSEIAKYAKLVKRRTSAEHRRRMESVLTARDGALATVTLTSPSA